MRNRLKIIIVCMIDAIVFASLLLTFAWFHHAKPQKITGHDIPVVFQNTPVPTATPEPTPVTTVDPNSTEGPTSVPTEPPTPEPTGLLGAKFAEKFTIGDEVIYTDECYRSSNVAIEISEHSMKVYWCDVHYFVADVYIRDITSFRCAVSDDDDNKEWVLDMARANNAIVATSGDYFLFHKSGLAIRNGQLLRDKLHPDQDVCVLYRDGTMETYLKGQIDLNYIYSKDPWQAWSFGPRLLENGEPMEVFNTSVETWNPRCAIGYYEPGHYCLVVVDGRQTDYSYGLEMNELSKLMYFLGCTEAYNLDGGMTAMMTYNDALLSHPCGGGRKNCDIVYIAEPLV
ncbi:MAG: phosphodiester glycosidase family protein [Clostridia bacterium]|nr:phosphodiester glycosidase family protein [Clostridia bacterium]